MTVNRAHYEVDSEEGHWNSGAPGLGYTVRPKEGYFPPSPHDSLHDMRTEMVLTLERLGIAVRVPPPRGRDRRPVRDRHALRDADPHGRPGHDLQVRRQERRPASTARPRRSCRSRSSATTARACTATSRSGRKAQTLMADPSGYAGLSKLARNYVGGLLAHAPALLAFCAPDDELVPPARAGLRGAGQPRLLAAQPLGVHPHPDVLASRRRRSGSSSAAPTRPRTRTSRSRRC